jgi:hypothetical protein
VPQPSVEFIPLVSILSFRSKARLHCTHRLGVISDSQSFLLGHRFERDLQLNMEWRNQE